MNLRAIFRDNADRPESAYAWYRLALTVVIGTIGGVGMWSVPVSLPAVQADFGVDRAMASLPYTLTMAGFAVFGVWLGRLVDRFGIVMPLALGSIAMGVGYIAASFAPNIIVYALAQGILVGGGAALPSRSAHRATTSPARCGRHRCNT
jgi:MFS family permease